MVNLIASTVKRSLLARKETIYLFNYIQIVMYFQLDKSKITTVVSINEENKRIIFSKKTLLLIFNNRSRRVIVIWVTKSKKMKIWLTIAWSSMVLLANTTLFLLKIIGLKCKIGINSMICQNHSVNDGSQLISDSFSVIIVELLGNFQM